MTDKNKINRELIENFYLSFAAKNAEGMVNCYDDDIRFEDPAFGPLQGEDAKDMWRMLLKNQGIIVGVKERIIKDDTATVEWFASYYFSKTKRQITNHISSSFEFRNGKIIKQTDSFDLWKWAKQAFGLKGYLIGWSPFFKKQFRNQALASLAKYKGSLNQA